jgi:hypothetical protein
MSLHLTLDQIDDQLIGVLEPAAAGHLAACADCAARVAAAAAPIAGFVAVSNAWSERRSATLPLLAASATAARRNFAMRAVAGVAATAVLALTFAVHTSMMPASHSAASNLAASMQATPTVPNAAAQPQALTQLASTGPTETALSPRERMQRERISRDNQMLKAIDSELDLSESAASLGLEPAGSSATRVQD